MGANPRRSLASRSPHPTSGCVFVCVCYRESIIFLSLLFFSKRTMVALSKESLMAPTNNYYSERVTGTCDFHGTVHVNTPKTLLYSNVLFKYVIEQRFIGQRFFYSNMLLKKGFFIQICYWKNKPVPTPLRLSAIFASLTRGCRRQRCCCTHNRLMLLRLVFQVCLGFNLFPTKVCDMDYKFTCTHTHVLKILPKSI